MAGCSLLYVQQPSTYGRWLTSENTPKMRGSAIRDRMHFLNVQVVKKTLDAI